MRNHSLLACVLACLSAAAVVGGGGVGPAVALAGVPAGAEELVQKARHAYEKADYPQAVRLLRTAVTRFPGSDELWALYDRAVVARELDGFLSSIPKDRYKLMPWDYQKAVEAGKRFFILDVREPEEFDKGHLKGSINVPFREVMKHLDLLPRDQTILLVCRTQHRSNYVMEALRAVGFTDVLNLAGGYRGWLHWLQKAKAAATPAPGAVSKPAGAPEGAGSNSNGEEEEEEEDYGC